MKKKIATALLIMAAVLISGCSSQKAEADPRIAISQEYIDIADNAAYNLELCIGRSGSPTILAFTCRKHVEDIWTQWGAVTRDWPKFNQDSSQGLDSILINRTVAYGAQGCGSTRTFVANRTRCEESWEYIVAGNAKAKEEFKDMAGSA